MTRAREQLTCLLQRTNWLDAISVFGCVFLCECGREKALTCVRVYLSLSAKFSCLRLQYKHTVVCGMFLTSGLSYCVLNLVLKVNAFDFLNF